MARRVVSKGFSVHLEQAPTGPKLNNLSINKDNDCNVLKHIKYA